MIAKEDPATVYSPGNKNEKRHMNSLVTSNNPYTG
jgi:hypothetical protein